MISNDMTVLTEALNELNLNYQIISGTDEKPIDQIYAHMGKDQKNRDLSLELLILPNTEEINVLQMYVCLPFKLDVKYINETAKLILSINENLPVLGFGIHEKEELIYFRNLYPYGKNANLDKSFLAKHLWLMIYFISVFTGIIEGQAIGEKNYNESKESLKNLLNELNESVNIPS